jgi:hypothetical protein
MFNDIFFFEFLDLLATLWLASGHPIPLELVKGHPTTL